MAHISILGTGNMGPAIASVAEKGGNTVQRLGSADVEQAITGDQPTTVLIAGDDADAKAQLAELVTAGGLRGIDAGDLRRARELEALGFLQITLAAHEKIAWTGGFALQG